VIHLSQLHRLLHITTIFVRHGLDEFVITLHLFRPYRWLLYLHPERWRRDNNKPRAIRLREALEELGPVFIKFGQALSTRPDLLPDDIAFELTRLQDKVPSFPGEEAEAIIARAYETSIDAHFQSFDLEPFASASVAQVHYATLYDDTKVVVKVLRPGIEVKINRDVELLYTLARLAERYWPDGRRLRVTETVGEFDKTIHDELDLQREAANASQLGENFKNSELIYIPRIYWDHTRRQVMVMERIHGIPIRDIEAIREAGVDMKKLAHDGVEIFYTQAFRDGFFHADMHPGNIFVSEEGQYRAVDFGIMGTLSDADKRYLADNMLAFFNRDYRGVAEAHLRAGWISSQIRVEEFEAAIRTVCEPIFAKPISEISFGRLLVRLFQVARRFQMPVQPQLILLQKTLLAIEGLGLQLYPQLDLWETAKPFLEDWMSEQVGPKALLKGLHRDLPKYMAMAPELPGMAHELLSRLRDNELELKTRDREVQTLKKAVQQGHRRLFYALVGSVFIATGGLMMPLPLFNGHRGTGEPGLFRVIVEYWPLGLALLGFVLLFRVWPRGGEDQEG
jgi:ubiquinone biosynthesis protein|tara:strand:- start:60063 stop:61757 length:1695 start_codon:yes stop_codon:yes gene_type:complete